MVGVTDMFDDLGRFGANRLPVAAPSSPEAVATPGGQDTPELSAGPFFAGYPKQIEDPGESYSERSKSIAYTTPCAHRERSHKTTENVSFRTVETYMACGATLKCTANDFI